MRNVDPLSLSEPSFRSPFWWRAYQRGCSVSCALLARESFEIKSGFCVHPSRSFRESALSWVGERSLALLLLFFDRTSTDCRARLPREALPCGARAPRYTSVCLITSQASVLRFNIPAPACDQGIASSVHEKGTSVSASSICS